MKAKTYKPTFLICPKCNSETDINITQAVRSRLIQFQGSCDCCGQKWDINALSENDVSVKPAGTIVMTWNLVFVPAMTETPMFMVAENPVELTQGSTLSDFGAHNSIAHSFSRQPHDRPRLLKRIMGFHAMKEGPVTLERCITKQEDLVLHDDGTIDVPATFPEVRDQITLYQSGGAGLPAVKH